VPVGEVVARGEAEMGFQQVNELLPIKGIDFLGPLPADIREMTVFSAGLDTAASAPVAAKALVKVLDRTRGRRSNQEGGHAAGLSPNKQTLSPSLPAISLRLAEARHATFAVRVPLSDCDSASRHRHNSCFT
jgi:hypothetical protein